MNQELIWQASPFSLPDNKFVFESLPESLIRVASLYPKEIAVICNEISYSFEELLDRVIGLSEEIIEFNNSPGPIALLQTVGLDAVAAWFACSLSGRSFLLLDPDHPPARLLELIETAKCAFVLGDHRTTIILEHLIPEKLLVSDGRSGTVFHDKGLKVDELAMLFPTSGSTGKPKLIGYATITLQVKLQSSIQLMKITQGAKVLIAGSHSNYGFLHHALVFLLSGGSVCLTDVKANGFGSILNAITQFGVRHVRFTPSLFRKLAVLPQAIEVLQLLEGVRFSGEPLLANDIELARGILHTNCLIQNIYGSTESALFIWNYIDNEYVVDSEIPIGRIYPFSSFAIRPFEDNLSDFTTGELLICSKFHALGDYCNGYIDDERFPLLENGSGERIYATGDIVNQLPNGNLTHLGRIGRMTKIRGNRVFLSEIEHHLRTISNVIEVAVLEHKDQDDTVIYAFISVNNNTITSEYVKSFLASRLPDYMIPYSIEIISQIPLMTGGKVDYQLLSNNIPSRITSSFRIVPIDDYDRLVQLWDSILWEGAHKHDSDFQSLGGDSIRFMTLLVEVEQTFGKILRVEDFSSRRTLNKLASLLEIDRKIIPFEEKYEFLQARLLWPSLQKSKGVALAMPGFTGWPYTYSVHQAEFFKDYDLWVLEYPIKEGNLLQDNRWEKIALEIVNSIQQGTMPIPHIIFGFSFSGGLAWVVARLLTGSSMSPQFVIMLDAVPLHRLKRLRNNKLLNDLKLRSTLNQPSILHIRRAFIENIDDLKNKKKVWKQSDNIQFVVELPTVSHFEMNKFEMLFLAKEAVNDFLNSQLNNTIWSPNLQTPDLLGVDIYNSIQGNVNLFHKVMDQLRFDFSAFEVEYFIDLYFVMHSNDCNDYVEELLHLTAKQFPNSLLIHFLKYRKSRNIEMLISEKIPSIFPLRIAVIETKFAQSQRISSKTKSYLFRLCFFTFDFLRAVFEVVKSRIK